MKAARRQLKALELMGLDYSQVVSLTMNTTGIEIMAYQCNSILMWYLSRKFVLKLEGGNFILRRGRIYCILIDPI